MEPRHRMGFINCNATVPGLGFSCESVFLFVCERDQGGSANKTERL